MLVTQISSASRSTARPGADPEPSYAQSSCEREARRSAFPTRQGLPKPLR
jgi:hypothetical protein